MFRTVAAIGISAVAIVVDALTSAPPHDPMHLDVASFRMTAFTLVALLAAPALVDVLLLDDLHVFSSGLRLAPERIAASRNKVMQVIGVVHRIDRLNLWHALFASAEQHQYIIENESLLFPCVEERGDDADISFVKRFVSARFYGLAPFLAFAQRFVLGCAITFCAYIGSAQGTGAARVIDATYVLAVVALMTWVVALQKVSTTHVAAMREDNTSRLAAGLVIYACARVAVRGRYHCSEAQVQRSAWMVSLVGDGTLDVDSAVTCTTCSTAIVALAVFAGTFAASATLGVSSSALVLPPSASTPLTFAAVVMYVASALLALLSSDGFEQLSGREYQLFGSNAAQSPSARFMRRFAQTGVPIAQSLYCAAACAAASLALEHTSEGRQTSWCPYNLKLVDGLIFSRRSVAVSLGCVVLLLALANYANLQDGLLDADAEYTMILTLGSILLYCVPPAALPMLIEHPSSARDAYRWKTGGYACARVLAVLCMLGCWLAQVFYWVIELLKFSEGWLFLPNFNECTLPGRVPAPAQHSYTDATLPCRGGILPLLLSPQLSYFTIWSLLFSHLCYGVALATLANDAQWLSGRGLHPSSNHRFFRIAGGSIALALFFCAGALFPADDGSKSGISRGSSAREICAFLAEHVTHVLPWLLMHHAAAIQPDDAHDTHNPHDPTRFDPRLIYYLAPWVPLLCWMLYILVLLPATALEADDPVDNAPLLAAAASQDGQTGGDASTAYPSSYPDVAIYSIFALLSCGIAPWVCAGLMVDGPRRPRRA